MSQKLKLLFLLAFLLISPALVMASEVPKEEESNLIYGSWKLPSQFTQERLEKLLSQLSQQTHNIGFRYLGVDEDLFHGHLLFERVGEGQNSALYPRAILYHTQEEAHKAHWEKSIDPKYDYLNVATRNWIQWLSDDVGEDGNLIENAKRYVDVTKRDPKQFEVDFAEPEQKLHYTIHASNLDNQKLGFQLAGELQFEFHLESSKPTETEYTSAYQRGPISVSLPTAEKVSLILTTQTMFIEREVK